MYPDLISDCQSGVCWIVDYNRIRKWKEKSLTSHWMSKPLEVEVSQPGMQYADKQHIAYFSLIESTLFYSLSEHTPKRGRVALYGSSSYAVGLVAPNSRAQLGHLYGSRSETLRLGSLRCRAYLAELYSVVRRAVRDSPLSSTEYCHVPYGIVFIWDGALSGLYVY